MARKSVDTALREHGGCEVALAVREARRRKAVAESVPEPPRVFEFGEGFTEVKEHRDAKPRKIPIPRKIDYRGPVPNDPRRMKCGHFRAFELRGECVKCKRARQ